MFGCRHCAAVFIQHTGGIGDETDWIKGIREEIDRLSATSFDPYDYVDQAPIEYLMTQFYNFIQDKVLDKKIKSLCRSIEEFATGKQKEGLYSELWHATDTFESPHDEWCKDVIHSISGYGEYDDD